MPEEYNSVLIKHFGNMYVWGKDSWDEDPDMHIKAGRELLAEGDYFVLRNIADIHNQPITQENQNA